METATETMTIAHDKLAAAVKAVSPIMPKKTAKPILRHLRVRQAAGGGLEVYATDLDTSVVVTIGDADRETVAATLLPAEMAAAVAREKGSVAIAVGDRAVETLGARAAVEELIEYPRPDAPIDSPFSAWVPFSFIRAIDDAVACATDDESSRYALGGVLIERRDGDRMVHAVGTDGRRLHVATVDDGGVDRGGLSTIIPPGAVRLFRKAVKALSGKGGKGAETWCDSASVGIRATADRVELTWGVHGCVVRVTVRPLQGRFPRWADCFPPAAFEADPIVVPIPAGREQIAAAARFQTEFSRGVCFSDATLSARSADRGEYSAPFVGTIPTGLTTKLDPGYLLEMIDGATAVAPSGAVLLHTTGRLEGVSVRANGGLSPRDGIGFTAILMPLAAD